MILSLRCPRHGHLRGVEHIFDKYPVPRSRIVDENVGDRSHELSVLNVVCGAVLHFLRFIFVFSVFQRCRACLIGKDLSEMIFRIEAHHSADGRDGIVGVLQIIY